MDDLDELLSNIDDPAGSDYEASIREEIEEVALGEESSDSVAEISEASITDSAGGEVPSNITGHSIKESEIPDVAPADTGQFTAPAFPGETARTGFTLRGTGSWNTREPYVMKLNQDNLRQENRLLQSSFFFTREKTSDDELKEKIRQKYLLYIRRQSRAFIDDYEHFIYATLIGEIEKTADYFGFSGEGKNLFIYHCGPITLYKMINSYFQFHKLAYCYRHESGNKSVRFYPEEFVRQKVLNWYEENINSMNIPFDSIQHLNEIKNQVAKKYTLETKRFTQKLEVVNAKLPPERRITREKLILLKGDELFGMSSIEVFRRFMDRTIFDKAV